MSQYDDGQNLSDYDFNKDGFGTPHDDDNNRKLAYRHRVIAHMYKQVCKCMHFAKRIFLLFTLLCFYLSIGVCIGNCLKLLHTIEAGLLVSGLRLFGVHCSSHDRGALVSLEQICFGT